MKLNSKNNLILKDGIEKKKIKLLGGEIERKIYSIKNGQKMNRISSGQSVKPATRVMRSR